MTAYITSNDLGFAIQIVDAFPEEVAPLIDHLLTKARTVTMRTTDWPGNPQTVILISFRQIKSVVITEEDPRIEPTIRMWKVSLGLPDD